MYTSRNTVGKTTFRTFLKKLPGTLGGNQTLDFKLKETTMTTPRFKIRQDHDFIYIDINVPYVCISNCDFYIENTFTFLLQTVFFKAAFAERDCRR